MLPDVTRTKTYLFRFTCTKCQIQYGSGQLHGIQIQYIAFKIQMREERQNLT